MMKKHSILLTSAVALAAVPVSNAQVFLDFVEPGNGVAETDSLQITLTNGAATIGVAPSLNIEGVSGSAGNLNGTITIDFVPVGDTLAFVDGGSGTASWAAGTTGSANGINLRGQDTGWGVDSGSGNSNIGSSDEGIFMTFTFSGFDPVASNFVLEAYDIANNGTAETNMRLVDVTSGGVAQAGSGTVVGSGIASNLSTVLSSGDIILISNTSSGAGRLQSLTFNVVPEPSSYALLVGLFSLTVIALRRRRG